MWTDLKLGHHSFESFWAICLRSGLVSTLPPSGEGNGWGRKWPKPRGVYIDGLPNLKQSLHPPSAAETVLGLRHLVPSHYYSVHPRSLTHCLGLYLSLSSILTPWGNPAKTGWHTGGAYDPSIWHNSTPSNPTSNSDKSLRLWHLCP